MDYIDFGRQVQRLRKKRKLTQHELAERIGICPSFLGHIERGTRKASMETLIALCNVLEADPYELLQRSLFAPYRAPDEAMMKTRRQAECVLRFACELIEKEKCGSV